MTRRFNKFGLRRDQNFADLVNPQQSLDNILNGLVDVGGESFISQDLDAIRDISATTITNNDFRSIVGAAVKVTDSTGNLAIYTPVVKFRNRLDIAKFTVGEPNFYGGDGLTTRYYESNQINSTASDVNNIFTGTEQVKEVFWERGIFNFIAKINNQFKDIYGGISWNGFFRPIVAGRHTFGINTSGFYTFEIDDGNGNLVLIARKSQINTNIVVNESLAGSDSITFTSAEDIKNVLVGDVIIHPTIAQFVDTEDSNYAEAVTVTRIEYDAGRIEISGALAENLPNATTLTFRHRIGETTGRINYRSINLEQYRTYKIRYRFWIPEIAGVDARSEKSFVLTITQPNTSGTYLDYKWLYNEDYNTDPAEGTLAFGDFRKFYNSRITASGGTVGGNTVETYQSIVTKTPLTVTYSPPTSLANATGASKLVSVAPDTNIIPMTLTDGISIGQVVLVPGIWGAILPPNTRVKSISINEGVFLTNNLTFNPDAFPFAPSLASTVPFDFIDHRGLINSDINFTFTGGSNSVIVEDLIWNAASVGDIFVARKFPPNTVIIRKDAPNTLILSDAATANPDPRDSNETIKYFPDGICLIYRPNGVYNNTLSAFCNNVASAPTVVQSNAGSTTLTVAYLNGIDVNDRPQFGTRIAPGTFVTNVNASTKVVTLSAPLIDDIPTGQLITFAPAGTTDNKELCFPPIDTSPPFTATALGLTTTSTRPTINIAPTGGAISELKFVGLSADGVPEPTTISPTANYTRGIRIRDVSGAQFTILSTT
jgi:hypothetical protein